MSDDELSQLSARRGSYPDEVDWENGSNIYYILLARRSDCVASVAFHIYLHLIIIVALIIIIPSAVAINTTSPASPLITHTSRCTHRF